MLGLPKQASSKFLYKSTHTNKQVLSEVGNILMSATSSEELIKRTADLIRDTLESRFCSITLGGNNSKSLSFSQKVADTLSVKRLSNLNYPTLYPVNLLRDKYNDLYLLLQKNKVAVFVDLGTTGGYIVIGSKNNSKQYNDYDLWTIEALSNELLLALASLQRVQRSEEKIKEITRTLEQTTLKLKTLDQTKDDFISMASHQLRTPLTSVKGYVSMVLDGDAGEISPLQHKLLNQAFISSQRMVYLISDLLNVSRIRTGKFIVEPIVCDLSSVVKEEVDQLVGTAESRDLEIIYNKPEHFPILMLDETKLRQVIMNFIDNAIYYTPSGGSISVSLVEKSLSIEFTVVDTGIGVPKDEQHRLFTKFFRGDNAKRARPDGTGLGLFMAKKVIIAQGGSIIFKSQEGRGSTFGFSFAKSKLVLASSITQPAKL